MKNEKYESTIDHVLLLLADAVRNQQEILKLLTADNEVYDSAKGICSYHGQVQVSEAMALECVRSHQPAMIWYDVQESNYTIYIRYSFGLAHDNLVLVVDYYDTDIEQFQPHYTKIREAANMTEKKETN